MSDWLIDMKNQKKGSGYLVLEHNSSYEDKAILLFICKISKILVEPKGILIFHSGETSYVGTTPINVRAIIEFIKGEMDAKLNLLTALKEDATAIKTLLTESKKPLPPTKGDAKLNLLTALKEDASAIKALLTESKKPLPPKNKSIAEAILKQLNS